jgi:hypothetical protein
MDDNGANDANTSGVDGAEVTGEILVKTSDS